MLFIRNFPQPLTILMTIHNKYRILPELKEVKYIAYMDAITPKPKH